MGMIHPPTHYHVLTHNTRHCADAILSFSNEVTLVSRVSAPLFDFAAIWAQSCSDYDFIIAQAFPPSWCSIHRPVLSRQDPVRHSVYAAIDPLEPDGRLVFCHRGCGREHLEPVATSQKVKIKCLLCRSTCEVGETEVKGRTSLSQKGIYKTDFPVKRAETNWNPPKEYRGTSMATQLNSEEVRGRQPKAKPSQAQGSRGNTQAERHQTHSVPRLPSQTTTLLMPTMQIMGQVTPPYPNPSHQHPQFAQPFHGVPQPYHFHQGWLPTPDMLPSLTGMAPPPIGNLTPPPAPAQPTRAPQRQHKRQKLNHNPPAPPS